MTEQRPQDHQLPNLDDILDADDVPDLGYGEKAIQEKGINSPLTESPTTQEASLAGLEGDYAGRRLAFLRTRIRPGKGLQREQKQHGECRCARRRGGLGRSRLS